MVIDLGDVRDGRLAAGPRSPDRGRRRALAVVTVVVALLAICGAATPVRPVLVERTISFAPGGQMHVLGDVLFLVRGRETAGTVIVEAYRLNDGELAWRSLVREAEDVGRVDAAPGVLLIMTYDNSQRAVTVAVQPTNGREMWRRLGWWQRGAAGQVILQQEGDLYKRPTIEAVAVGTGQVRWSLPLSSDEMVNVVTDRLVWWSPSGRVEVRDLGSGRVLAAASLPVAQVSPTEPSMLVSDRLLLVSGRAGGQPVVTAYGLDLLDRRWQAPIDLAQEYVSDECGDVVCLARIEGGVRLVDVATGETRWSDPQWGRLRRAGPYLVADEPLPPGQDPRPLIVLDPATGDVVADLGRWSVTPPAGDGRMVGVRHEPGTSRAVVALLDPVAARARVASVARDVVSCESHELVVVCWRRDGSAVVWRPPTRNER